MIFKKFTMFLRIFIIFYVHHRNQTECFNTITKQNVKYGKYFLNTILYTTSLPIFTNISLQYFTYLTNFAVFHSISQYFTWLVMRLLTLRLSLVQADPDPPAARTWSRNPNLFRNLRFLVGWKLHQPTGPGRPRRPNNHTPRPRPT